MPALYTCPHCKTRTTEPTARCAACGRWIEAAPGEARDAALFARPPRDPAEAAAGIGVEEADRIPTGIGEFDRVLGGPGSGGGLVRGGAYLFAGLPGRGKTSLMLQVASALARALGPVLYLSAELSKPKVAAIARRVGALDPNLYVLADTGLEEALAEIARLEVAAVVVDYIQKVRTSYVENAPGTVPQLREVSARLVDDVAHAKRVTVLAIGELEETGAIAGPMALQYMYDALIRFDDETLPGFVLLRVEKNRYGPRTEIGCFAMTDHGLEEVADPSRRLLGDRLSGTEHPGVGCLLVAMEGTRPIATEVQVVFIERSGLSPAVVGYPRGRLQNIRYALDRLGFKIPPAIALSVLGGYRVADPAADLAVALVLAAASVGKPVPAETAAIGEVDLTGRVLPAPRLAERLGECDALGVPTAIVPATGRETLPPSRCKTRPVRTLAEALRVLDITPPATHERKKRGGPPNRPTGRRGAPGVRPPETRETKAARITTTAKTLERERRGAARRRRAAKAAAKARAKKARPKHAKR